MKYVFTALAGLILAGCSLPQQAADAKTYEEPAVVTGSHMPRKTAPAGVQAIDGDSVRAQGQIAPNRGIPAQKGQ